MFYAINCITSEILISSEKRSDLKNLDDDTFIVSSPSDITCFFSLEEMHALYEALTFEEGKFKDEHAGAHACWDELPREPSTGPKTYSPYNQRQAKPARAEKAPRKPRTIGKRISYAGLSFELGSKPPREGTDKWSICEAIRHHGGIATFEQIVAHYVPNVSERKGKVVNENAVPGCLKVALSDNNVQEYAEL